MKKSCITRALRCSASADATSTGPASLAPCRRTALRRCHVARCSITKYLVAAVASQLMIAAGCRKPPALELVPVVGKVTLAGRPLPGGAVSLRPEQGSAAGHHPTGRIEPGGIFTIFTSKQPGCPPGTYKVLVFATADALDKPGAAHPGLPKSIVPKQYGQLETTPLVLEVAADRDAGSYDLKLE